jgi:hypothetical protein
MRKRASCVLFLLAGAAVPVGAEVFTVGPAGEYASIQAALTEAARTPPNPTSTVFHEIRVQRGTYPENLRAPSPCCGRRSIQIVGGWNSTFSSPTSDPTTTEIDGRSRGRVFTALNLTEGTLELIGLTLRGGYQRAGGAYGIGTGAGLRASLTGQAALILRRVDVRNNIIRGEGTANAEAQGAGAMIVIDGQGFVRVDRCRFLTNMIVQGDAALASYGGGLNVQTYERGLLTMWRTEFTGNWAYGSRLSYGGGLFASVTNDGAQGIRIEDSSFQGNFVHDAIGEGTGATLRTHQGGGVTTASLTRCRFVSNNVGRSQLSAAISNGTRLDVSDSLVADGRGGVQVVVNNSTANLRNLTVADNERRGVQGSVTGGRLTVFNTIASGNAGGDLSLVGTEVVAGFNLVGIDPGFRPGTYELDGGSAAADAGTNTPPVPLLPVDLALYPRIYNATVDIGAYEWRP